ncbi:MAG TPA: SHOCT domain-containing protein [Candidatus Thermoplasmatota archaeon]|nr:SHOCT domain-containing protein [Candidatus Thermoplasmatota archaeon]
MVIGRGRLGRPIGFSASALVLSLLVLVLGLFLAAYGATVFGPSLIAVGVIGLIVCFVQGQGGLEETAAPASPGATRGGDRESRLRELADLHAKGLIDEGDLHARRRAILDEV